MSTQPVPPSRPTQAHDSFAWRGRCGDGFACRTVASICATTHHAKNARNASWTSPDPSAAATASRAARRDPPRDHGAR